MRRFFVGALLFTEYKLIHVWHNEKYYWKSKFISADPHKKRIHDSNTNYICIHEFGKYLTIDFRPQYLELEH